jgi:antitoxin HigA-1
MKITTEVIEIMQMFNPPHPGEIIKELCLEPLGLTVTRAAQALGVSRKTLSAILNGRAGISPEMAIRLSIAFDTSAESWLNQQVQYDLWLARQSQRKFKVERLIAI